MRNPFYMLRDENTRTEQEAQRLKVRMWVLLALFSGLLITFIGVLINIQLVHGEEYLNNASYTVVNNETVETVRGEIADRYGNVMVTNELSYNVELDVTRMGSDRNRILCELMELCRREGVEWSDSFPVTDSAPWGFTRESPFSYEYTDEDGTVTRQPTLLGTLAKRMGWVSDPTKADLTAEELMLAMCDSFGIEPEDGAVDGETRALLGLLYETYLRLYEITYNEYVFAYDVDIAFITMVKERDFAGVEIASTTSRRYTTDVAAHVLGYVGKLTAEEWPTYKELGYPMDAVIGKEGVELAFESFLHGSSGIRRTETDDRGNVISEEWSVEPEPGNNVILTLDSNLQKTTEQLLAEYVATLEEGKGAAAVMVDMTGGVLSLASYPTYDLSTFSEDYNDLLTDPNGPLFNRATMGLYAPGSTFKPLVAMAALSEGIISPSSTVWCTGLYYHYADYTPACWIYNTTGGTHASETVAEAITDSCNIFFYDVGRRLGITKLGEYAAKFGLGQYTGIEIAEYRGTVAGPETSASLGVQWYGGNTLAASIGQENNKFSPLQLANYVATLVNGGNHYEVHLIDEVKSADYSETVYKYQPVLRDTVEMNARDLAAVKKGMYDLSKTYTMNLYFGSLPVEVGCKTGTAEVGGGATANAVFVCFAPYDDPQVALCIVAEHGASGGSLASVAAGMLAQYFSTADNQDNVETENGLIP